MKDITIRALFTAVLILCTTAMADRQSDADKKVISVREAVIPQSLNVKGPISHRIFEAPFSTTATGARRTDTKTPIQDEAGPTIESAAMLSLNQAVEAAIDYGSDADVFGVNPTVQGSLLAETVGKVDTFCELLDVTGMVLATDDNMGDGKNCRLLIENVPAGLYYVRVTSADQKQYGAYTLSIEHAEDASVFDDYSGAWSQGTEILLGELMYGYVDYAGDEDVFVFEVPVSAYYDIATFGETNTFCTLKTEVGVPMTWDDDTGIDQNCGLEVWLDPGVYVLEVKHASKYGMGAYATFVQHSL